MQTEPTLAGQLPRLPPTLATADAPSESSSDAIDKVKVKEIVGFQEDIRTQKFFECVLLPLGVCLGLILLLRRGLLR